MKRISIMILVSAVIFQFSGCTMIFQHMKDKRDKNYKEGLILYKKGNYEEANDKFDTVVSIDPEYKDAKKYLTKTRQYVKKQERKEKKIAAQNFTKGVRYKNAKKYEEALDIFLLVKEQDPDHEYVDEQIGICRKNLVKQYEAKVNLAEQLFKKKKFQDGYRACLVAKKYDPMGLKLIPIMSDIESSLDDQTAPYREKAEKYSSNGRFDKAKEQWIRVLQINPWDEDSKESLANCNRMIAIDNEYGDAEKAFRKKNYLGAYSLFIAIDRKESGYKKTEDYIDKIRGILSNNINVYYNTGLRYYDGGNYEAAISEWNKILIVDPGHSKAREYRERAQAKLSTKRSLGGS